MIVEELGVAVHGQGFPRKAVTEDLAMAYPAAHPDFFNIGILHTALTGAEGHELYAPCSLGTLQSKGYDVWALGHVHTRQVVEEDPLILFPGNTQGRHVREAGPKGCTLVKVEDGRVTARDHHSLHVVRWETVRVDVSGISDPIDVVDKVRSKVDEEMARGQGDCLAARIRVEGSCRAHGGLLEEPEKWLAEIRAGVSTDTADGAWVERVEVATRAEVDLAAALTGSDALSDLVRFVDGLSATDELKSLLAEDLRILREKLPPEVFYGDTGLESESSEELERIVADVKGLLIPQLLASGAKK